MANVEKVSAFTSITNRKEAIELAHELERLNSARKQISGKLQEYVKVHGQLDTGDRILEYVDREEWNFDAIAMRNLAQAILEDKKNPWEYFNIKKSDLNKLKWSDEKIQKIGGEKGVSKRWSNRKS